MTGDLFRENLRQQTELGKLAKAYMDRGELVPDDITEAMVQARLARSDVRHGFLLDGFPRTLPQAEALEEMIVHLRRRLAGVLYLNVSDEELVQRLSGRLICRQCQAPYHRKFKPPRKDGACDSCAGELYQRDDDNPATVRARLKTFHAQTEPLTAYYEQAASLRTIRGEGDVRDVAFRASETIEHIVQRLSEEAPPVNQTPASGTTDASSAPASLAASMLKPNTVSSHAAARVSNS